MSTKKLQIVTPIVTSVNGKTGDVTLETVDLVGGTGKYIQSVQQTDGKISATAGTMPTALKNPEALSIAKYGANGRNEHASYNGSAAQSIKIYEPTENLVTTGSGADNPPKSKTVKEALDGKISKAGDTFSGELVYSNSSSNYGVAIDLGRNGCINNTNVIYFYYNESGSDRGFYIQASRPATDGHYASAQFLGNDGDESVRLCGIAPPKDDDNAANKAYVDNKVKYLTTDLYGTTLPTIATAGQIFFKKL